MLFPFVSQKAAVPSFVTALGFGLLIGFGGPKPPVIRLSGDISLCGDIPESDLQCSPNYGNSTTPLA